MRHRLPNSLTVHAAPGSTRRGRRGLLLAAALLTCTLALPASAWAHAALLHTDPSASVVVDTPPAKVALTYSEAVEPRFAIISVTNAAGQQQTTGSPTRSQTNPDELDIPVGHLAEGWYLVYWRVISVDGHPVRGAFTFAVGPNPGPAPQFVIPSISETAATPQLLIARWITFVTMMVAIGLFVLRTMIAQPMVRRVTGTSLRSVAVAFWVSLGLALIATPVYIVLATAKFALRSPFALGTLLPLVHVSAFGRGYLDLEIVLALFALCAAVALWVDRPEREQRSVAQILAMIGALAAASAALLVPGLAGHAAQTAPRGISLVLDWLHLASGSLWIGGLIGLLILWRSLGSAQRVPGLAVCVPRFSTVAFVSVAVLLGSGIGASFIHLPTLSSLWETSYGKAIVLKVILLAAALVLASGNLLRSKPRLVAAKAEPERARQGAALLRRLAGGEMLLAVGAVFVASLLSSLPPPPKELGTVGQPTAHVGPGPVTSVVKRAGYQLEFHVNPNRAAVPNTFAVRITRDGKPVQGADVTATFTMLDMEMGQLAYHLEDVGGGLYQHSAPALVMVGHWGLSFDVEPKGAPPFNVLLLDTAHG